MIPDQIRTKMWAGFALSRHCQIRTAAPPAASTKPQWNVIHAAANDQGMASWTVVVVALAVKKKIRFQIRRL